ncbi:MAG TPA: SdpI family protein [Caulobacteraceae bacterium]|jgi:uncharacterized membrane protein
MIRKGLLLSLVPLAVIGGLAAWGYASTEPGVLLPVHWGLDGEPDRFGSREEAFLGLPAVAAGLTLLMAVLPYLDPRGTNLRRSEQAYLTAWIGSLSLLALVQAGLTMTALGVWEADANSPFHRLLTAGIGLFIAAIGNVLGKARPNWVFGVRTPWTLSSDLTWERTHRWTGRLFVLVGLAGVVAAFVLPPPASLLALVGGLIAAGVWSSVYSYLVWRNAPDKRTGPQAVDP